MTQEEKAKRYDKAIEVAQRFYNNSVAITKKGLEDILPELVESEDEMVRKWIIENIQETLDVDGFFEGQRTMAKKAIAWLEAQGEHANFRNKIQVGDKVTRNRDGMLVNLSQLKRVAKPAENKGTNLVEEEMTPFQKKVFFIVDTAIEEEQGLSNICNELLALAKQEIEQNFGWTEEDEKFVHGLIRGLSAKRDIHRHTTFSSDNIDITNTIKWLKSLKDRVQPQPKQEWSEEDECCRNQLIIFCENCMVQDSNAKKCANWLKSLRPQNTWKPSEEQIIELRHVISGCSYDIEPLVELETKLKEL